MSGRIPIVVLFGPTAVGKTDVLFSLFRGKAPLLHRAAVVSADSMQVYRGMDIGTAKPSPQERSEFPHYLIDIRNPDEQFSVGDFVREADTAIRDATSKGLLPILSGGTAFYLRNFLYGLPDVPPSDPSVRSALEEELKSRGARGMHSELQSVDPVSASKISPGDSYRVLRALEVFRCSGIPRSAFAVSGTLRGEYEPLVLGLERDREELYRRINRRVDAMFENGLADEVRKFMKAGYTGDEPGMKAIGYREFFLMRRTGCLTFDEIRDMIKMFSRRYAKRQLTFFRSIPGVNWFHADDPAAVASAVSDFLASRAPEPLDDIRNKEHNLP